MKFSRNNHKGNKKPKLFTKDMSQAPKDDYKFEDFKYENLDQVPGAKQSEYFESLVHK